MQAKLTQTITNRESQNVLDNLLFEGRISIETYGDLVNGLRNFDPNREMRLELVMDEPLDIIT